MVGVKQLDVSAAAVFASGKLPARLLKLLGHDLDFDWDFEGRTKQDRKCALKDVAGDELQYR